LKSSWVVSSADPIACSMSTYARGTHMAGEYWCASAGQSTGAQALGAEMFVPHAGPSPQSDEAPRQSNVPLWENREPGV
jgi:hypothetical protein